MKKEEKELLFDLLKKASGNINGFTTHFFTKKPLFTDDNEDEIKKSADAAIENQVKAEVKTENLDKSQATGENMISVENNISAGPLLSSEKHFSSQSSLSSPSEKESFIESSDTSSEIFQKQKLSEISSKIQRCSNCQLSSTRKNSVPGEGVSNPYVLVIGEAPGEEEDLSGRPFVGKAGELLDKMLGAIGLSRNANTFIANTVKCRPPKNRDPQAEEMKACRAFLDAQISILKPKYILLLGKVSVRDIFGLQDEFSLSTYRQKILEYFKIPVIVTYHPSALLRNPEYKKPAWEDLKLLGSLLKKNYPEYSEGLR